jgi:hypothetical protein
MRNSISKLDDANALVETHLPAKIRALLGKPPLLANEDLSDYNALLNELAREVKPKDFIEWLWVKDIADLTWEIIRLRRIKAAYVNGQFTSALASRLKPAANGDR